MRCIFAVPLLLLALPAAGAESLTALQCGHVFDALHGRLDGAGTVLVADERIREVLPGKQAPTGAETIDLGDSTCLPGLIDSHTHLTGETSPTAYNDQFRWNVADYAIRSVVYAR
ncbi:MAG TPA: amidohydrolase family protein, partial [Rhodanobacteraceae bacterium]|nr:amidohydrolase family protein [Rhodanobacteraceae bacterium]